MPHVYALQRKAKRAYGIRMSAKGEEGGEGSRRRPSSSRRAPPAGSHKRRGACVGDTVLHGFGRTAHQKTGAGLRAGARRSGRNGELEHHVNVRAQSGRHSLVPDEAKGAKPCVVFWRHGVLL